MFTRPNTHYQWTSASCGKTADEFSFVYTVGGYGGTATILPCGSNPTPVTCTECQINDGTGDCVPNLNPDVDGKDVPGNVCQTCIDGVPTNKDPGTPTPGVQCHDCNKEGISVSTPGADCLTSDIPQRRGTCDKYGYSCVENPPTPAPSCPVCNAQADKEDYFFATRNEKSLLQLSEDPFPVFKKSTDSEGKSSVLLDHGLLYLNQKDKTYNGDALGCWFNGPKESQKIPIKIWVEDTSEKKVKVIPEQSGDAVCKCKDPECKDSRCEYVFDVNEYNSKTLPKNTRLVCKIEIGSSSAGNLIKFSSSELIIIDNNVKDESQFKSGGFLGFGSKSYAFGTPSQNNWMEDLQSVPAVMWTSSLDDTWCNKPKSMQSADSKLEKCAYPLLIDRKSVV